MVSFFGFGRPSPSAARHAPLPAQDDELDAAFGMADEDDAHELSNSVAADEVRISIDGGEHDPLHPRSASDTLDDDGSTTPRPDSPSSLGAPPLYDSSLTDAAANRPSHPADHHAASWRDRLTSSLRYGRLATADPDGEVSPHARLTHQPFGSGLGNDGVFANIVAKPEIPRPGRGLDYVGGDDNGEKEVPPSYEMAAADTTPPYWETTVIAPQGYLGPDDILVDGLPVGNLFGFAWNLLVSMSFQFVGFLLTYLLHTSHAAKNGSRAGLGITLIQWAFYLRQRAAQLQSELDGETSGMSEAGKEAAAEAAWEALWGAERPTPTGHDGSLIASLTSAAEGAAASETATPTLQGHSVGLQQAMRVSSVANNWLSYVLLALGSALVVGALINYLKAVRWAQAVRRSNGASQAAAEAASVSRPLTVL